MDRQLADEIDIAVQLQRQHSAERAFDYLLEKGAAEHTILRVLACAAFRRK